MSDLNNIKKLFKTVDRHTEVCDMSNVNNHRPHQLQVNILTPTSKRNKGSLAKAMNMFEHM